MRMKTLKRRAMARGVAIADKASDILRALRPLYDAEMDVEEGGGRNARRRM